MLHLAKAGFVLAQDDTGTGGSIVGLLLPLVVIGGLFYFLLIRPQRRRQRQMQDLRNAVEVGDDVRTVGGIYGTVTSVTDADIFIDIGDGTKLRIAKRAIAERIGVEAE